MSQEMMDPELLGDFIIEAKEHLETIEPNLLELEKAPDNLGLLNEIFRPMHSLKGASGFLGLGRINHLAHKSENILDELRKGAMQITPEIMDVILSSTDALRQMIENIEATNSEGDVQIEHIAEQIDAIMAGETPGAAGYGAQAGDAEQGEPETSPEGPEEVEASSGEDGTPGESAAAELAENDALSAETADNAEGLTAARPEEHALEDGARPASDSAPSSGQASEAAPSSAPDADSRIVGRMDPKSWIDTLEQLKAYPLTAFGEGHLKDFVDESWEIIENLNDGLLKLEDNPSGDPELVNDIFRYFHNLKGNSGIIGYHDLNSLTHEAETLLNNVRRGEMSVSHELIDLLLLVVDVMEVQVEKIDVSTTSAQPLDASQILEQLKQAVAGGAIELPPSMFIKAENKQPSNTPENNGGEAPSSSDKDGQPIVVAPVIFAVGDEDDDEAMFRATSRQQMEIIRAAMQTLQKDSSHKDSVDAIYRCLIAVKNASGFVGLNDIKVYADRTAGIVDKARTSGLDFSLMLDLLTQEFEIIQEMLDKASIKPQEGAGGSAGEAKTPPPTAPKPAPQSSASASGAPAQAKPAIKAEAAASPAPKTASQAAAPNPAATQAKPAIKAEAAASPTPKPATQAAAPNQAATQAKPAIKAEAAASSAPKTATQAKPAIKAEAAPARQAASPAAPKPPAAPPKTPIRPPSGGGGATPPQPPAGGEGPKGSSTIRVDHEKLDHLMNLIGELIINRNRYTMIARQLEEGGPGMDVTHVAQSLSETTYAMARISDDLQDTIMKVRMVPVSSVFSRFPRLVRDLSRKSGKEVDLVLEGEETELDKSVVEVIGDPLVHLIRNAVDHGIEAEADRVAKGKKPKGRVVLRAFHKGNSVAIEIEDDGKGIDPETMREVAVRKGILTMDDARQLDDREAMELIFAPGFSSAETITDISGRGVGMDVVRTNIKNLKGSVNISSEVGKGTRFTLSLPLTLAIIDALMVNVAGEMYAIPLDAVSETTKIQTSRLTDVKGRKAVTLRGEVLGVVEMAEILCLPRSELPDELSVVVIHDNDRRLGLVVDRLLERQEIVIKPLGAYLGDLKGISGATIMGDGSVILILDPHEIYIMSTSNKAM